MIWIYAAASTIGLTAVVLVQMAICSAVSSILFGSGEMKQTFWTEFRRSTIDGLTADETIHRARLAASWQNWVFNSALTFLVASLVEETFKYLPIVYARRRGTVEQR